MSSTNMESDFFLLRRDWQCGKMTEQGKSKKVKGTHKEKEEWSQASKFIYGDSLFTFYFYLFTF
jgi:hypothetical protein